MSNVTNSLVGLGLLTGDFGGMTALSNASATFESRAQRAAKAAFTTPESTPPWKAKATADSEPVQVSRIRAMRTVVDKPSTLGTGGSGDVNATFVTYKALDRLKVIAERAAASTTGTTERELLQKTFAKGLADLEKFLATAPSEKIDLAFGKSARQAQTGPIAAPSSLNVDTINGKPLLKERDDPLEGVTGNEKLTISLASADGKKATFAVDLSTIATPPTLEKVSNAINAVISAESRTNPDGTVQKDAKGDPVPQWSVKLVPTKIGEKWGLSVQRGGFETISIDQVDAPDAVMVANGVASSMTMVDGRLVTPAVTTQVIRLNDPSNTMTRLNMTTLNAVDRDATERQRLSSEADITGKIKATNVDASLRTQAMVSDAKGNSYLIGTTAGDLGGSRSDGQDDMVVTKLDSEGKTVWQRNLGTAGAATGAAISIDPKTGGVVVAATVTGGIDGNNADGDMFVARFSDTGEETSSTLIRQVGTDTATAIVAAADGTIYVGGRTPDNGGDGYIARIDALGRLSERRVIGGPTTGVAGSETVKSLAIGSDGKLLALTGGSGSSVLRKLDGAALAEDVASIDVGTGDARAMAVGADGQIAVVGAATSGQDRNAFLARIDAKLTEAKVTTIGGTADDQADSVSFLGTDIYVGGRTSGTLGETKTGTVDAFVARIDAATGTLEKTQQFGTLSSNAQPVQVSAIKGGNSVLGALGLNRGMLSPTDGVSLQAQTSLRPGDEFSLKLAGRAVKKITIEEGDTLTKLADKVRTALGTRAASVTTPFKDGERSLRIDVKAGQSIQLIAGADGRDALEKLGLDARRISAPAPVADDAPKVRPGGTYGLGLSEALQLSTKNDAKNALGKIEQAISYTQTAYRSLYWDETKAKLVDVQAGNGKKGGSIAVEKKQLANYQAALSRLSSPSTSIGF